MQTILIRYLARAYSSAYTADQYSLHTLIVLSISGDHLGPVMVFNKFQYKMENISENFAFMVFFSGKVAGTDVV